LKKLLTPLLVLSLLSCTKDKPKSIVKPDNKYYNQAWYFSDKNIIDSSFIYFNKAKEEFSKYSDSVGIAKCLINMAIISGNQGDHFGSQEFSLSAIKYLNTNDKVQQEILSSNYNNLGKISQILKRYDSANEFYRSALNLAGNEKSKNIYRNNIAINLSDQKKYRQAIIAFEQLIRAKLVKEDNRTYSRVLSNLARSKWLQDPAYNAEPELLKALAIREKENDFKGQNASYAHLADYYTVKEPEAALINAHQMYQLAQKLNSPDDRLQALQKLINLSPEKQIKHYFEIYQKLSDSIQTARSAAKNQFALIRYETEKNKADNLKLQKENTDKRYQIATREFLLIGTVLLLIAGSAISVLWYKKRKQKLELEAQNAIREGQLKTSKKVHDVVANGLYRVMTEIENQTEIDKNGVLDKIEDLYEKSRDISYDKPVMNDKHNHELISELLTSFATEHTKLVIAGNTLALWDKTNATTKFEVEHILQELMVNMKKHSQATKVAVRFEEKNNHIYIHYTDNGVGMKEGTQHNNGLRNTGNRIASINGAIIFDLKVEQGLKIQISFPFS
jgi:tetratricopeptide (TPR) repeat protein